MTSPSTTTEPTDVTRHAYRVARGFADSAKILPLPGKRLTEQAVAELRAWLVAQGWTVLSAGPTIIKATCIGKTWQDVPVPLSQAQCESLERDRQLERQRVTKQAETERVLTQTAAGLFVVRHFGDVPGAYNASKMAKFLDSTDAKFMGLLSWRVAEQLRALGIEFDTAQEAMDKLKAIFERTPELPAQPGSNTAAQPQPVEPAGA